MSCVVSYKLGKKNKCIEIWSEPINLSNSFDMRQTEYKIHDAQRDEDCMIWLK